MFDLKPCGFHLPTDAVFLVRRRFLGESGVFLSQLVDFALVFSDLRFKVLLLLLTLYDRKLTMTHDRKI